MECGYRNSFELSAGTLIVNSKWCGQGFLSQQKTHMCFPTASLPVGKAGGHASLKNSLH